MLRLTVQSLKVVTILVVALVVAVGGRVFFDYTRDRVADPEVGQPVRFAVTEEDDGETLAARLHEEGLVRSERYFSAQLQLSSGEIVPGEYTLRRGMSVTQIIASLTGTGDAPEAAAEEGGAAGEGTPAPTDVTVVEGSRIEEIAELMAEAGLPGGADAFIAATQADYNDRFAFLADRPEGATLEGYLFPDTYTITAATNPEDVVLAMLTNFDQQFTQELRDQAAAMTLSVHQVVTLASIVEREVQVPSERPIVAAVYLNRLDVGMQLQADPTVQYAIGRPGEWWKQGLTEEDLAVDNPYNTYVNDGLPPGPIASPGLAAMAAVLAPDDGGNGYLYFVAKNDGSGEHAFTTNYDEHLQNLCTYLEVCG